MLFHQSLVLIIMGTAGLEPAIL